MEIDHIFIFSNSLGQEADRLVDFGFAEGSSRTHQGQGTRNRKFYFENFFLEILWVINEEEIQNELTARTKLWERSQFEKTGYSPFGLCLANSDSTNALFDKSELYKPDYLPEGMSVEMITNEAYLGLPFTFRLPHQEKHKTRSEPTEHANGIKLLSQAEFEIRENEGDSQYVSYFQGIDHIKFRHSNRVHLTLEFDSNKQGKSEEFSELNLTVRY